MVRTEEFSHFYSGEDSDFSAETFDDLSIFFDSEHSEDADFSAETFEFDDLSIFFDSEHSEDPMIDTDTKNIKKDEQDSKTTPFQAPSSTSHDNNLYLLLLAILYVIFIISLCCSFSIAIYFYTCHRNTVAFK